MLLVKPEHYDQALPLFEGSGIQIQCDGVQYLVHYSFVMAYPFDTDGCQYTFPYPVFSISHSQWLMPFHVLLVVSLHCAITKSEALWLIF